MMQDYALPSVVVVRCGLQDVPIQSGQAKYEHRFWHQICRWCMTENVHCVWDSTRRWRDSN